MTRYGHQLEILVGHARSTPEQAVLLLPFISDECEDDAKG